MVIVYVRFVVFKVILYFRFVVLNFSCLENVLNEKVTIVEYTRTEISLLFIILHVDKFIPCIPYTDILAEDGHFGRDML